MTFRHFLSFPRIMALALVIIVCRTAWAEERLEFRRLDTSNGLADCHVSSIIKDRSGFLWFGTAAGLSRYDGFRFKNFYNNTADKSSIISNQINDIQEDADGNLWVFTNEGYCIYNPATESFSADIASWMRQRGMSGTPNRVFVDTGGNYWVAVNGKGCYYYDRQQKTTHLFRTGKGRDMMPQGYVNGFAQRGSSLVAVLSDGTLVRLDGRRKRVVWVNRHLAEAGKGRQQYYALYIDSRYNYWASNHSTGQTSVYSSIARRWFDSPSAFLSSLGLGGMSQGVFIKDVCEDSHHSLWLATEHEGLFVVNIARRTISAVNYDPAQPNSLPDNTLQSIYVDKSDGVWIGSYKNGVAYWSPSLSHYPTVDIGDVCTIATDSRGNYWCGTNDVGIVCYNPHTGATRRYGRAQTQLGTDVVVSSLAAADGTMWFGTYNGGLTRLSGGTFTAMRAARNGLANNSVWALAEDRQGNIIIGTLGSGVQIYNPRSRRFTTFDTHNSALPSDFVSAVRVLPGGNILVGHSVGISIISPKTRKVTALKPTADGSAFASKSVNDAFVDSRGLIWNANMSGLDVYDPSVPKIYHLNSRPKMACAVTEDKDGNIWATSSNSVVRVKVSRKGGNLSFFSVSFDEYDGLQKRRFNYRSICLDRSNTVVTGGQDGINTIPAHTAAPRAANTRALFSGIVVFDHQLSVGERYMGRVILPEAVNASHKLRLDYDENAFTVLLASDSVAVPQKSHFLYRLKGFGDDKWLMTVESQPSVTYTNLHPGNYTLQVRVVGRDGTESRSTSELHITIEPPFWLTPWAYLVYMLLVAAAAWLVWHFTIHRKMEQMRIEHMQREAERMRKMDEMKLAFLTDISHELRTPLSLVIAPVKAMVADEANEKKRSRLQLVLRNANRLLNLVNQTLDLRKIESNSMTLDVQNADIVKFVAEIVESFARLAQKRIDITFGTEVRQCIMPFDADKMDKIMNNLLSNAYKFTPDGGAIRVTVSMKGDGGGAEGEPSGTLTIAVADTGCGISDADKEHIFDRFYQASNHGKASAGGSGLGLNIAHEYALMHGGDIAVADNEGGGTVFTLTLPVGGASVKAESQSAVKADKGAAAPDEARQPGKAAVAAHPAGARYDVLVVDDSEDFLSFMTEMLSADYTVRTATNGREALELMHSRLPDVILSDVMMPEMDGNALCRAVKENPQTAAVPFIMLTARLSNEYKIEGFTSGADEYLTKPFDFDLLHVRINKLIEQRRQSASPSKIELTITPQAITSVDEQLVADATAYVESHIDDTGLSVETMSAALNMSRVHLYKRLLSVSGNTPSEFIRIVRVRHAGQLLRESQLTVSEIAYKVGFNQPRLFSKYFSEYYGVKPSQYRNGK